MDGHLLSFTQIMNVSAQLVRHLLDAEAAPQEATSLTVLRVDQVVVSQRRGRADTRGLFAELRHVERDATLALGRVEDLVSLVDGDHGVIHL